MFVSAEWYWRCVVQGYLLRTAAVISVLLSAAVVWSEVTFFNKDPVLSIFANFLKMASKHYDYLTIEVSAYLLGLHWNLVYLVSMEEPYQINQMSLFFVETYETMSAAHYN